ncbi:hypothetical protein HCX50_00320 [Microbacterium oxydans]|uniref:hypothetical protein n=1 Tax=Microbacterium sp. B19(2022) TaxID=2914045 RepID=UPI0014309F18|nr:hypothetical protein [Microbacterium sp. B19(2022)]NJI57865.1 hypothetical protein [Microbacterium sp. B19(2022)]
MTPLPRRTLWISIVGVLAVTAYAAVAAVQILVLNPLAAVPGRTLDEIRAEMDAAGEVLLWEPVAFILGIGVVLAVVVAIASIRGRAHPMVPVMSYLALLMLGAFGYFTASFGVGMSLADTFGISGGDYSPWARPLYAVSLFAGVALVVVPLVMLVRRRTVVAPA